MKRRRGSRSEAVRLPNWLLALTEPEPSQLDVDRVQAQFRRAGVTELGAVGSTERPEGISCEGPTGLSWIAILLDERESPVVAAVEELAESVVKFEELRRIHIAYTDMELVATAAAELAPYRHTPGEEDAPHDPYAAIGEVMETGLIVLYARNFTGHARLGDRWRPKDHQGRELHNWLVEARDKVHAHADFTSERTMINTTEMLDMDGPPIFAERRTRMSRQQLEAIARLCEKQAERFYLEAARLKAQLGSPTATTPGD